MYVGQIQGSAQQRAFDNRPYGPYRPLQQQPLQQFQAHDPLTTHRMDINHDMGITTLINSLHRILAFLTLTGQEIIGVWVRDMLITHHRVFNSNPNNHSNHGMN